MNIDLFSRWELDKLSVANRLVRSATYEGLGTAEGYPTPALGELYATLAASGVGLLISGFVTISQQGRAMHPGQCSIAVDSLTAPWRKIVSSAKSVNPRVKLVMQLAHAGRQTRSTITKQRVVGASSCVCSYFRQRVKALTATEIEVIIGDFALAAQRAKDAGFDAVQIHAAHGYLVHQFLSPHTNNRNDKWGDRGLFLQAVVEAVKQTCGEDYPVLLKISGADDFGFSEQQAIAAIKRLGQMVSAVEVSYGTMERPLNIIRGGFPVADIFKVNPFLNRIPRLLRPWLGSKLLQEQRKAQIPFSPNYNAQRAAQIAHEVTVPVFAVGGVRNTQDIRWQMEQLSLPAVSLCRPFLADPQLALKLASDENWQSPCISCNRCTVSCDASGQVICNYLYDQNERVRT